MLACLELAGFALLTSNSDVKWANPSARRARAYSGCDPGVDAHRPGTGLTLCRDRSRGHWLKALGHAGEPLELAWLQDRRAASLTRTGFPRRPRMLPADRLVYYAPGWRCVFALVEVVEAPTDAVAPTGDSSRWPWSVGVEALLVVPRLDAAPPVEAIGVGARSMSQQSHIRLTPAQYAQAVEAIGSVGR